MTSANWQYILCRMTPVAAFETKSAEFPASGLLADLTTRKRLTPAAIKAVVRLAGIWGLGGAEAAQLLGVAERTWFRMKKGTWSGALSQDELTRASALIGIFKGLQIIFSRPLSDEWVGLANQGALYGGRRPLDVMLDGGIPAMLMVRRHVDALRGGL